MHGKTQSITWVTCKISIFSCKSNRIRAICIGSEIRNSLIELGEQQVATLHEAVSQTEQLMRHSSSTYLEVLTARQSLLDAQQKLSQYRFDNIQGLINLYHALGGG